MNGRKNKFWQQKYKKERLLQQKQRNIWYRWCDVNKILVSKKEQYSKHNSFKYFIGYNDNNVIRPLYLFLSQATGYINKFDKNKTTMSLMIIDMQLLKL